MPDFFQEEGSKIAIVKTHIIIVVVTLSRNTPFFFYKNLVYKNVKASKCPKIKNVVVTLLVAISISFKGFGKKMTFL